MNKTRSKVMTIANRLVKQGLTRSTATVKAWIIVKANALRTKVKGTSRRQSALEKLAGVNPADISVKLEQVFAEKRTHRRLKLQVKVCCKLIPFFPAVRLYRTHVCGIRLLS